MKTAFFFANIWTNIWLYNHYVWELLHISVAWVAVAQEEEQSPTNPKVGGLQDNKPHAAYQWVHQCQNVCEYVKESTV